VRGFYTAEAQEGDCEAAEVTFYAGGGNAPGAPVRSLSVSPSSDQAGTLTLDLPPTTLAAGPYWISVVCSGDDLRVVLGSERVDRRWNWHLGDGERGRSAVIRNDEGGFGLPPGWISLASLGIAPPSYSFALYGTTGSVSAEGEGGRLAFALSQNYPNPFSGRTRVTFETPAAGPVRLAVYDALGRRVAVLVDATLPADRHTAEWDAAGLASGVYLIRLQAGEQRATLRALVVD
jgi:hypothetical protein